MIRPLLDHVLVRVDPIPEPTGLIVSPNAGNAPIRRGTVLAVGPGRDELVNAAGTKTRFVPTQVCAGDRVVFVVSVTQTKGGQATTACLEDGQVLIREPDILGVLEDEGVDVCV